MAVACPIGHFDDAASTMSQAAQLCGHESGQRDLEPRYRWVGWENLPTPDVGDMHFGGPNGAVTGFTPVPTEPSTS
ncbi:hypothetical protein PsYK624_011270 [Phanerochaete sordida]|uniref:Uncharacterized protein n=1 Tax=Phanerochaete sordida TaxID=48140 RepID=A0A9P3FZL0_9APHY|nr:hypothetical protein PsYK624_011270 [Phanerochaete sordida]